MPSCASLFCGIIVAAALWLYTLPREPPNILGKLQARRVVVLTGGTGGLGLAAVHLLAERGDVVYTCGRNAEKVEELNGLSGVHASVVDVSKPEEVFMWASRINATVDVLINNAGALRVGDPAATISMKSYSAVMDTNVRGVVAATTAFWPKIKRPSGRVINIGSTTETPKLSQAFHSIYMMSKCALRAYSVGLRQEGRLSGISVVHVKAGAFQSNLHSAFDQAGHTLEQYPLEFSKYARAFQASMLEKVKLVKEKSGQEFARMLYSAAHTDHPASEYWFNVSWLEIIADLLPQWLLDWTNLQSLSVASADGVKPDL